MWTKSLSTLWAACTENRRARAFLTVRFDVMRASGEGERGVVDPFQTLRAAATKLRPLACRRRAATSRIIAIRTSLVPAIRPFRSCIRTRSNFTTGCPSARGEIFKLYFTLKLKNPILPVVKVIRLKDSTWEPRVNWKRIFGVAFENINSRRDFLIDKEVKDGLRTFISFVYFDVLWQMAFILMENGSRSFRDLSTSIIGQISLNTLLRAEPIISKSESLSLDCITSGNSPSIDIHCEYSGLHNNTLDA